MIRSKGIISWLGIFAIFVSLFSVLFMSNSYADSYESSLTSLWDLTLYDASSLSRFLGTTGKINALVWSNDNVCANAPNGVHYTNSPVISATGEDENGPYALLTCAECGHNFRCYSSDLQTAYNDYVGTLPATGYDSGGYLYYYVPVVLDYISCGRTYGNSYTRFNGNISADGSFYLYDSKDVLQFSGSYINGIFICHKAGNTNLNSCYYTPATSFSAPISGLYKLLPGYVYYYGIQPDGTRLDKQYKYVVGDSSYIHKSNGDLISPSTGYTSPALFYDTKNSYVSVYCTVSDLVYQILPDSNLTGNGGIYNINTRINNTSFNLATVENNEITQVYQNVSIINETNNTIYNPVTNETYEVNNWNYDYSTRTYEGTLSVDPEVTFELAYHDDKVVLKIGDLEFDLNYVVEEQPEPTPTPGPDDPTPTHTPLPTDSDVDTDDTPYWLWLMDWLDNFKAWLGDKLGSLGGGGDVNITYNDNSSVFANVYEYEVTYENSEGEEESFSFKKLFGKFRWIKDVWTIGQELVSVVSSDAAYAYDFNVAALDYGQEAAIDSGEEQPIQDGNGELEDLETDGAGIMVGGAPSLTLNLGAAQSHYGFNYGGEVEFLDLSWYTPYKSTVDGILSGFLWIFFVWKLFQKAPGIISGAAMDSSKVEDIRSGERRR